MPTTLKVVKPSSIKLPHIFIFIFISISLMTSDSISPELLLLCYGIGPKPALFLSSSKIFSTFSPTLHLKATFQGLHLLTGIHLAGGQLRFCLRLDQRSDPFPMKAFSHSSPHLHPTESAAFSKTSSNRLLGVSFAISLTSLNRLCQGASAHY